jgi:hypothetical protein
MIGRIGDDVQHTSLTRCEGCGQSTLMCEVCMDHPASRARCCTTCTHLHDSATLAQYGLLDR